MHRALGTQHSNQGRALALLNTITLGGQANDTRRYDKNWSNGNSSINGTVWHTKFKGVHRMIMGIGAMGVLSAGWIMLKALAVVGGAYLILPGHTKRALKDKLNNL